MTPTIHQQEQASYRWFILISVLISTFLAILSAVATIIADSSIQGELALSHRKAIWITTLYLLGVNTVVPGAGWFADRFGYKRVYLVGLLVFTFASGIAGLATNFFMIGAARFLEGIGGGLIFPVGLSMISQNFPQKRLPLALSLYVMAVFGCGISIGLIFAGYCAQFYSWRLIFLGIFILGALSSLACSMIQKETKREVFSSFDSYAYILFAIFITTLLIALTYGPLPSTPMGWRSPFIIGCFVLSFLCLSSTIYLESRAKDPFIPLILFKDPIFATSSIAMFLLGMSIFASVSTMADYMLQGLFYEKYVSAKIACIYGIAIALFSLIANALIKKIPSQFCTLIGLFLLIISYFLNGELSFLTGPRQIVFILLLRGIGVGLSLGPTTILAMQNVDLELRNKAATLLTFFRQVGGTFGGTLIAIFVIKRKIFHAERFSEQTSANLSAYKVTLHKIFQQIYSDTSTQGVSKSLLQSNAAIVKNLETQAFITAQNDALFFFGCVASLVALTLLTLNIVQWIQKKRAASSA